MLFDIDRHEALSGTSWSESVARETISEIVSEAAQAFNEETGYLRHRW